ncbi:MAG: saccharopine dehydrogenase NADP-binding domain-containing protein [Anaerolineae bacterium]|nr:saccharopine dehydrogenase NADP-binding domain-containing protein [Anaerolineae bacterium]
MRVFVLGGYGKVGLPAIKLLAASDLVTEIAIAGRSLERAQEAASEIGGKAVAVQVDGTDEQALASLLAGHDIILNAAATKAVLPAIRAATCTGVHYCDVATFGDAVGQALTLAPEAEAAGITAIVAIGISPCISNLMGVHVARQMDEVEQLQLGRAGAFDWRSGRELTPRQWLEDPKESFAGLHAFRGFIVGMLRRLQKNGMRTVLDYQDGRWVEVDPIRSGLDVPHLRHGGTVTAHPYVSCNSFWGAIPRDLARVSPTEMWFGSFPPQLHAVLCAQALRVLDENTDPDAAVTAFYDTIEGDPHRWLTPPDDYTPLPKMWVRAVGRREGRAARCTCWFTAPMWDVGGYFLTSVALVAATLRILHGETRERGVMTAEKAFEPLSFFDEVVALLPDQLPDGKLIDESFEWLE